MVYVHSVVASGGKGMYMFRIHKHVIASPSTRDTVSACLIMPMVINQYTVLHVSFTRNRMNDSQIILPYIVLRRLHVHNRHLGVASLYSLSE